MTVQKLFRSVRSSIPFPGFRAYSLDDEVALYRRRAEIALKEERFLDAIVFLAKVLRLNPYDLGARMAVAEIYHFQLLELEKAIMSYEQVLATAGYDDSNPFCRTAKEAIRSLANAANSSEVAALEDENQRAAG